MRFSGVFLYQNAALIFLILVGFERASSGFFVIKNGETGCFYRVKKAALLKTTIPDIRIHSTAILNQKRYTV